MKYFSIVLFALLTVACGSQVYIPGDEPTGETQPAPDSTVGLFPGEMPGTTSTSTTTEEPPVEEVQLLVKVVGPPTGQILMGSDADFYAVELTAVKHTLRINTMRFRFVGYTVPDGGPAKILSESGNYYFMDFRVMDTFMSEVFMGPGPNQIVKLPDEMVAEVVFNDSVVVTTAELVTLAFVAKVSPAEYLPGEFIGNSYMVSQLPFEVGDVTDLDTGKDLSLSAIKPNGMQIGNLQEVVP